MSWRRTAALLLVLSACGRGGGGGEDAAERPTTTTERSTTTTALIPRPYLGPLRFDWPTGCTVPIVEEHEVLVEWVPVASVERSFTAQLVDEDGATVISLAGDVDEGMPSIVVDADGRAIEVRATDGARRAIAHTEVMTPLFHLDERPDLLALAGYWATWVGLWSDLGSVEDDELAFSDLTFDVDGVALSGHGWIGSELTKGGITASLRRESAIVDAALARLLSTDPELASQLPTDERWSGGASVIQRVVTDPATLVPTEAALERNVHIQVGLEDGFHQEENRRWTFDWAASDCDGVSGVS